MLLFSLITKKPHESSERYPIERVLRLPYLPECERARWVPDAEFFHAHAKYFCGQKMPELMDNDEKNENADNEKSRKHSLRAHFFFFFLESFF